MAEDSGQERTEDATPHKKEEARNEGRIARSPELNTAVVLLGSALVLNTLGPGLARQLVEVMQSALYMAGSRPLDRQTAVDFVQGMGWRAMAATSTMVLAMTLLGGVMATVQARGVLTMVPLEPKLERINPLPHIQRFFGKEPWIELVKSLLKLALIGVAVWQSLAAAWQESLGLSQTSPFELVNVVRTYGVKLLFTTGLCYLGFAGADYLYQIWKHQQELRMTKQEVKEENKQNEGDPMVKARLRAFGRSLARKQMLQEVPRADVVVTNPTHIAVALKYDPNLSDAPVVVAMGQRKVAERIKQIAREAGVPTVENKPLARALLASARVGTPIPPDLYRAVAEVLAWVIGKHGRLRGVTA